jgi:phosphoribosyl-AMP cyclohydrolase
MPKHLRRTFMRLVDKITFDDKGLVPAIIQDYENNEVLMLAYMNLESLKMTLESGKTHFWSRSRKQFWMKGENSGHTQEVKEVLFDCDQDALLIRVKQNVGACHTGYRSCFYRRLEGEDLVVVGEKVFEEKDVY